VKKERKIKYVCNINGEMIYRYIVWKEAWAWIWWKYIDDVLDEYSKRKKASGMVNIQCIHDL